MLLSTYDSRGGVEPLVALAVRLRALGAEVLVCAPPDCAERLAEAGVPLVPAGEPVRALVHRATPPSPDDVPRLTAELIATWFDKVAAAAEGCDALVASGVIPAAAGARSVAEKLGIHSVHVSYCPIVLPSPYHPPTPLPGRPLPPQVTGNRMLWDLNARTRARATAVAGRIRTDGAAVAATLLVDAISGEGRRYPGDALGSRRRPATSDRS